MHTYDYLIVGGGIFGVYGAIYLSRRGYKVLVIERESSLFQKASIVNQARLHAGYHYPRSVATARIACDYKERFIAEHKQFINFNFSHYYGIDRYGSLTNASQFERFCELLGVKARRIGKHPFFNFSRLECLYLTEEYSFDPVLIARYYTELLNEQPNITLALRRTVREAEACNSMWRVRLGRLDDESDEWVQAGAVINATYAGTNTINRAFHVRPLRLVHEITELALVSSPSLSAIGLTIMDGQFCSMMPYGLSQLLSVSSVPYTHHKVSYEDAPAFDCQNVNTQCKPDSYAICNECSARPPSNYIKMLRQLRHYLSEDVRVTYAYSLYTIKSKLQSSHIDDARPTDIALLRERPPFYCLFAGKINSIYEIESQVGHA